MTRYSDALPHDCPMGCGSRTTTSICAACAETLTELGVVPCDPEANADQTMMWRASLSADVLALLRGE